MIDTSPITETEREWLNKAREYAKQKLGKNHGYLEVYKEDNIAAWRDFIADGYEPQDAVEEDLSYAD